MSLPRRSSVLLTALRRVRHLTAALALTVPTAPSALAAVLDLEVTRRAPLADGRPFVSSARPDGIPYELVAGRVRFGVDPEDEANARIVDLEAAPRGSSGRVEATADFLVLQPTSPTDRSGTALVDVPNRGRRLALALFNRVERRLDAPAAADLGATGAGGDGFLMEAGLTVMWVGWQHDAPAFPGALRLDVPRARRADGTPIEGLARSDWVVDEPATSLSLATRGHVAQPVARPADDRNRLTRRRGRDAPREPVDGSAWRFAADGRSIESTQAAFAPGWIYELVYVAQAPPVAGLGFVALRDFVAFAKHDPRSPFPIERAIAHGLSQSGRFLRHFFHEGMDADEAGRAVFDGAMIQIGGGGRGGFNHRFGHPGRVGNPYANFFYPGDELPFTSRPTETDGQSQGLFDRSRARGTMPKLFQVNTGYEYWGRGASLVHTTPDGARDVAPVARERLYHLAGAPHYSLGFPPDPRTEVAPGLYVGSRVDTSVHQRALLVRLLEWVERDVAPPTSRIPTLADGSLVRPASLRYPLGDLGVPRAPHVPVRLDHGPDWPRGIVDEPPRRGAPFAVRVPAIDALGNEATGIRPIELAVPVGTWLPWALRHGMAGGADEMTGYIGTFLPLAARTADRRPGDRRPALDALYPTRDAYAAEVASAIDVLVAQGFLLPRDRIATFEAALARFDWVADRPRTPATPAPSTGM